MDYQRVDKGRITSYRTKEGSIRRIFKTLYGKLDPNQSTPRFITIYPIYPDSLKELRGEARRMKRLRNTMKSPNLERNLGVVIFTTSLLASLMFFSTNLTGLAISNLNQTDINIVGIIFFVFGVLGILMSLRKKEY
ncbi:hypothetical protein HYT25_03905 [Candidatus Pacearchaeota archaeon]|nr:hypothetical protein [Candidatus Pacearchaeota archaeon]